MGIIRTAVLCAGLFLCLIAFIGYLIRQGLAEQEDLYNYEEDEPL